MIHFRRQFLIRMAQLTDLAIVVVCFALSVFAVSSHGDIGSLAELLSVRIKLQNFLLFLLLIAAWHGFFILFGLYRSRRLSTEKSEILDILKATTTASLVVLAAGWMFRIEVVTGASVIVFWCASAFLLMGNRLLLRSIQRALRVRGRNLRYILIVGANARSIRFAEYLREQPELGYRIAGFVDDPWAGLSDLERLGETPLAELDGLPALLRETPVDEVAIFLPLKSAYEKVSEVARMCEEQGIIVRFPSDIVNFEHALSTTEDLGETSHIAASNGKITSWYLIVKRLIDLFVSAGLLLLLSPLFLLAAVLINRRSPGPVFFAQERVGLGKRRFLLYKFRTMVADAEMQQASLEELNEVSGPVFKIKDDPRVTPLGKFLRKTSIDELPQLFNVLAGDMSLVGPRPLPVRDYRGFDQDWHRRRFSVRPGITCLWQINGRSSVSFEKWMELDMQYIDEWSPWLDTKILFKTVPAVLKRSGAE